jgi:hypothetical protein
MVKIKFLLILLCSYIINSNAQINNSLTSNISKSEIQKLYFYEQIKPFDSCNYIYMAYKGMGSEMPNGVIVLLNKSGKVKKGFKLKYGLNDSAQWKNKVFLEHKKTPLQVTKSNKKFINQHLKKISWNQYHNIADSNYFCRETEINNKQYVQDVYNVVNVDDGDSRVIIIKFNNIIRKINLYMWSDFLTVCNLDSHLLIEALHKQMFSLLPK